jgi:cobalt-zinc-cadmium efflux system outer membrane protein
LKKYDIQLQLIDSIINNYEYQTKRGNIPTKEVVRLKSVYFEINSDRSEIASNLSDEMNNVRTLMGVTSFVHPIIDESKLDKLTVNTSEKIVEDALQNRPDLKSSKILQTTSQLNLKLQKLMNVPDLTYIASYDQHGGAFDKQFNSGFSFNLPTWNLNRGNIKAARLQSKAADAMTNQKEIDIRSEALQASDNFTRSLNEYKKAEQLYNSEFEEVFNGISENFQKRNISLLEFVDFIEAYNKSIAELQRVKTQLSIAAETINFVTAKEVY